MSVSTNGEISFGFIFDDGHEFPWDADPWEGDIDQWWMDVNSYANPLFHPYDERGNYKPGVGKDDPRVEAWHDHNIAWADANPVPVERVNYCSCDCPMYILAVPDIGTTARRGYPEKLDPASLVVTPEQVAALKEFCVKYEIATTDEPQWWLSSYYG